MGALLLMSDSTATLEQLIEAAGSARQDIRSCALQELLAWVRKDRVSHPIVLPVFRKALRVEQDPWGIVSATQGIENMVGGEEARNAWLAVLNHPSSGIVIRAASAIADRFYVPVLLRLLAGRPEAGVRNAAIRALGRMQCVEVLPVILTHLANKETRWDSIEALSNLGDPRAIPYLKPFLNDQSDLRGEDDRGCVIDVRHITGCAIRRLEFLAGIRPIRSRLNLFAYLPLIAAIVEIPWIIIVVTFPSAPLVAGTRAANTARNHLMDLLAAIPVAAGLLIGLAVLMCGTARRLPERVCLYLGCAVCAVFLYAFGSEFFN
ncbi:MAG: repeat protein [Chthoniobacteraceae bacterium]|nr:repeat protein [Chthoniobacteraceae bacterium]